MDNVEVRGCLIVLLDSNDLRRKSTANHSWVNSLQIQITCMCTATELASLLTQLSIIYHHGISAHAIKKRDIINHYVSKNSTIQRHHTMSIRHHRHHVARCSSSSCSTQSYSIIVWPVPIKLSRSPQRRQQR